MPECKRSIFNLSFPQVPARNNPFLCSFSVIRLFIIMVSPSFLIVLFFVLCVIWCESSNFYNSRRCETRSRHFSQLSCFLLSCHLLRLLFPFHLALEPHQPKRQSAGLLLRGRDGAGLSMLSFCELIVPDSVKFITS